MACSCGQKFKYFDIFQDGVLIDSPQTEFGATLKVQALKAENPGSLFLIKPRKA